MNILMLPYEVESPVMNELARNYKLNKNNKIYILNCDLWTFEYQKPNFYQRVYDKNNYNFHASLKDEYESLCSLGNNINVDFAYLESVEQKYSIKLNEIITTDPLIYTVLHHRDYINVGPSKVKFKWIELVCKKIENLFAEFKPDIILTIGNNYFLKNLSYHMSAHQGIKHLCVLNGRVLDRFIIADNLGINTPDYVVNKMKTVDTSKAQKAKELINSLNNDAVSLFSPHVEIINSFRAKTLLSNTSLFAKNMVRLFHSTLFKRNKFGDLNYFSSVPRKVIKNNFRNTVLRYQILKNSSFFVKKVPENIEYYYMALHVLPESTILTQGDDNNEAAHIIDICKKMPINVHLIVKENIEMLGERPLSFYKKLNEIHNLILVDPSMPSLALIKESIGVITICGTATLEAAIMKKKALYLGMPEYSALNGVEKYNKYTTTFTNNTEIPDNEDDHLRYLQAILELGEPLDMKFLMGYSGAIDYKSDKFRDEVLLLKKLFDSQFPETFK